MKLSLLFFVLTFLQIHYSPVLAAPVVCDPGEWRCCGSSGHQQCSSLGTGWYRCRNCTYGCNNSTGDCRTAPLPTATPRPPRATSTPVPQGCCVGNYWCLNITGTNANSYYSCQSAGGCSWNCAVPPLPSSTPIPTSVPTSTPRPTPVQCCKGSSWCSSITGLNYSAYSNCQNSDSCSWVNCPIPPPVTPSPCTEGQNKCQNYQLYTCYHGSWAMISSGNNTCAPSTYPGTYNSYDCPIVNGYPDCTQTNPLWANQGFPQGCYNNSGEYLSGNDKLYLASCGPATTCSLLCACKRTAEYCNLTNCLNNVSDYKNSLTCAGTNVPLHQDVLNTFPECFRAQTIIPDIFTDSQGQALSLPLISRNRILEALQNGPVQVGGVFNYTDFSGISHPIDHISLIVGVDPDTGKFIFNDPYFNPQNPNPLFRVNSPYLEDYMTISIDSANDIN